MHTIIDDTFDIFSHDFYFLLRLLLKAPSLSSMKVNFPDNGMCIERGFELLQLNF